MAFPRDLVRTISAALGLSEASLALLDRQLQEAGLRRKGGRGRSSVRVNADDAVALLCGIGAAQLFGAAISGAPERVSAYMALLSGGCSVNAGRPLRDAAVFVPTLGELGEHHTFGEVLTSLIQAGIRGELRWGGCVEVHFSAPARRAAVLLWNGEGWIGNDYWNPKDLPAPDASDLTEWAEKVNAAPWIDLSERRVFTHRTLNAIGDLLAGRGS